MTKYQVKYVYQNGEEEFEDELFDIEEEAQKAGDYGCNCYHLGGEILNMSNPGDYPLSDDDDVDFEIIVVNK